MSYTYDYPRPALTTDVMVVRWYHAQLCVLLIQRLNAPFAGYWALPGGFVDKDENPDEAALRELGEETALQNVQLYQLGTYGRPGRDPRGHTVSVVYWTVYPSSEPPLQARSDARALAWHPWSRLPALAFDHQQILDDARCRLCRIAATESRLLTLLPTVFTEKDLCGLYQEICSDVDVNRLLARLRAHNCISLIDGGWTYHQSRGLSWWS